MWYNIDFNPAKHTLLMLQNLRFHKPRMKSATTGLTLCTPDKMMLVVGTFSNAFSSIVLIMIEILLTFAPWGLTDKMSTLVQIISWYRTGNKLLPEPMMIQFTDAILRHSASMS